MSRDEPTDKPVLSSEESIAPSSSLPTDSEPSSSNSTLPSSYTSTTVNSGNKSPSSLSPVNPAQNTNIQDVGNSPVLAPWLFKEVDIALLFTKFKQAVAQISTDHLFLIESSIHELLSLSNILLLAPEQHSQLVINIFTEEILHDLDSYLLKECLDPMQDMSNDVFTKWSRIMNNVESNNQSKDDAEIELLTLGKDLCPIQKSLILGIKACMRKLPLFPIKNKQSLGECELFTMYFDPLLSALFSDPDKNILLRWSNVTCNENFGPSLGFGEVKLARPTTDNHALCLDLLRLGAFCKDTIDMNKLQAALAFQINGFSIIFYLMRLRHDGMYIMQEIGRVAFPASLQDLTVFLSLKNIRTLLMVSDVFWRLCKPVNDDSWESMRRPTHSAIFSLIHASKDRHRLCALEFTC
ncbi:hypothetical protein BY458DRAFT_521456 [Sporodiniella umbellata]|nr:hypothetical protein BY458DRAFT_521456 [Sporodiniella umbellata]